MLKVSGSRPDGVQEKKEKTKERVQYCLESVEEYSEFTIHKGEPDPRNGNVNTVYFINQDRRNTRISRYLRSKHAIANGYLSLSFLLRIMFVKNLLLQISFYA